MGQPHRLLVERREADGIDAAVPGEFECVPVIRQCEFSASEGRRFRLDVLGIEMAEIDEQRISLRRPKIGALLHRRQLRRGAGNARARVEDAAVADHDEAAAGTDLVERHELCGQLRADAGGSPIASAMSGFAVI